MSNPQKTHQESHTIPAIKEPSVAFPTRPPRDELPQSQDGFPLRFVTSYDLEAVKAVVAKLRHEINGNG